jgi:ribosomal protein L7Ae-like RNA K-turn-binding protein
MGASICKKSAKATAFEERATTKLMPSKAQDFHKTERKQVATANVQSKLPTKTWRALLNEQPMNADAKPFVPGQAPPAESSARAAKLKKLPEAAEDDPEWMQYLSKKLSTSANAAKTPTAGTATNFKAGNRHGPGRRAGAGVLGEFGDALRQREPAGLETPGEGPSIGGGAAAIHTNAYLKLLKEGSAKKNKAPNAPPGKRLGNKETASPGRVGQVAFNSLGKEQAESSITTSSLVKKWSSMVNTKTPGASELTDSSEEQCQLIRTTQDDIAIAKMIADEDLSDPAYYSDAELTDAKNSASIHRFGRRPHLAKKDVRTYVMQDLSYRLDEAVGMMLLRLQRFTDQQRSLFLNSSDEKAAALLSQQRRFVIGLKEVSRRTKQSKVECLIVAPDIEEDIHSGGLDDRMRELLATAYQNQTPVIFALSRARLGKALGKSLHISVLGVLDSRGAQGLLQESVRLASECRQTWLTRLGK